MKTFKFSLAALAATALFTACSNEVAVELQPVTGAEQAISFRLQGGAPELVTRATATTAPYVDAFVVYGIDNVATSNLFDSVTVALQAGGGFDYSPKKYYSIGATGASFFAYSPVNANKNIVSKTGVEPLVATKGFTYMVTPPDSTVNKGHTEQDDLLVADAAVTTLAAPVNLNFEHALSRVFVKAANGLSENVVITRLVLKNLRTTGNLSGTSGAWVWGGYTAAVGDYKYVLAESGVAVKAGVGTDVPSGNDPVLVTSMEQGMMVLPQVPIFANGGDPYQGDFVLEVNYDVANLTNQIAHIVIDTSGSFEFKAGNQYAITVEFDDTNTGLIEINFTITVTDFIDPVEDAPIL